MKALWAANTYWTSPLQVGANHLARQLTRRDWEVGFFSDPISPMHFLRAASRRHAWPRFAAWRHGGGRDLDGRLFHYSPFALWVPHNAPGLRGRRVLDTWWRSTVPNVRSVARRQGFGKVDLLVIDTVAQGFWLDAVSARRTVFRITDRFSGFEKATPVMIEREAELAQRADLVIYTARDLEDHVAAMKPKRMAHVPNGVNFAHFEETACAVPVEYADIPHPRAVYVGAMDVWFDYALLNRAAAALPDVHFVLIGPDRLARERIDARDNVHMLGIRPHADLPPYLHHADAGIIPFDVTNHGDLVHGVNPVKLYEYMACGLPTVAVAWRELAHVQSPAVLCASGDDFIAALRAAVAATPDRDALRAFARLQDWSRRASVFLAAIDLPD